MPYLGFLSTKGEKLELSGNSLAQFEAAFTKNGNIAHQELALAFVKAFFIRRDLQVKKQKFLLAGDEAAADAVDEEIEPAEDEEERAKQAYQDACAGKGAAASSSSSASAAPAAAAAADPYAFLKASAASAPQPPADDDFM